MNTPVKLLYVCTHNACRSILAEVITRQILDNRVVVRSAGSNPAGRIHPLTLRFLEQQGHSLTGLASQSFEEQRDFDPDIVVTVCDSAASEACPVWLGDVTRVHWGLPDPSHAEGSDEDRLRAFEPIVQILAKRLSALAELPLESTSAAELGDIMQTMDTDT